jgi:hypothetical protein
MIRFAVVVLLRTEVVMQPALVRHWISGVQAAFPSASPVIFSEISFSIEGATVINIGSEFMPCDQNPHLMYKLPCKRTSTSDRFGDGYKRMCRFWYARAWDYLDGYDLVLRVDDDLRIMHAPPLPRVKAFSSVHWLSKDHPGVTVGINDVFRLNTPPLLPYTNVMAVNMTWLNHNSGVQHYLQNSVIDNCICVNRWGDLPLWGYTLAATKIPQETLCGWKYFHESSKSPKRKIIKSATCA